MCVGLCDTEHTCVHGTCAGINTCTCEAGYTGSRCEIGIYMCLFVLLFPPCLTIQTVTDIDDCASSPCMHAGTCTDLVNDFSCTCPAAWEGVRCQEDSNACLDNPCVNNGICINGLGSDTFACLCLEGFEGNRCEKGVSFFFFNSFSFLLSSFLFCILFEDNFGFQLSILAQPHNVRMAQPV